MKLLFRYVFRNLMDSKLRTFLILFAVIMATALFFVSLTISDTLKASMESQMRQRFGGADFVITPREGSVIPLPPSGEKLASINGVRYSVEVLNASGIYSTENEMVTLSLIGLDQEGLDQIDGVKWVNGSAKFGSESLILSERMAEKLNLSVGDSVELAINGEMSSFTLVEIAKPQGLFRQVDTTVLAIVHKDKLAPILKVGGYNTLWVMTKPTADTNHMIQELSRIYPQYKISESVGKNEVEGQLSGLRTVFMQMSLMVLLLSVYIVGCSFRVIALKRLPVIGTLRSIGATKKSVILCYLLECTLYGVLGGILGCVLGSIALQVTAAFIQSSKQYAAELRFQFPMVQLILSFLTAIVLCLFSSVTPILRIQRIQLLLIITNAWDQTDRIRKRWNGGLGLIVISIAVILPHIVPVKWAGMVGAVCLLLLLLGQVLVMPIFVAGCMHVCERVYELIFGNEGILAIKNMKQNMNYINSISLLGLGLSIMLLVNTVGSSILASTIHFYNHAVKYDLAITAPNADQDYLRNLLQIDGVGDAYGVYQSMGVRIADKNHVIEAVQGVEKDKFKDYWNLGFQGDADAILKQLDAGRNIMITPLLKKLLIVDVGDPLTLETSNGPQTYKVIGFFNTMMSRGNMVLVSEKNLLDDYAYTSYSNIYVKAERDPEQVAKDITSRSEAGTWVSTTKQLKEDELEGNRQIFTILKAFTLFMSAAGFFGILNNITISFIERRRSLAILRSVGMSKIQMIKISLIEAFSLGMLGGLSGILMGSLLITIVPAILASGMLPQAELSMNLKYPVACLLAGVVIALLASMYPAYKNSNGNIMESVKVD